uniref:Ankyrin repeat, SAM and basic leucine zipper domain containing 1 n=1 Tax=Oncorhynchus tshawytscha TaxID=74940 RepID=A0A8C8HMN9_ONCTS
MLHIYFCSVYIDTLSPSIELPGCRGLDVEAKLGFEWTPLMCAVHVGHYDIAKLLLDIGASANFNQYTVLMAACMASAREDKMVKCVELLLSRNADQHIQQVRDSVSRMTSLMLVSRDRYSQVINLLVSHGAELGADKTKAGKIAADTAKVFKRPQVKTNQTTYCHIIYFYIGISNPEDQQKVQSVVKEMHLDRVDLDTLSLLENINSGSEALWNFLISLRQQRCCLTETVQDVISRFPPRRLVLSLDPKEEAQAICNELVAQAGDLQKEVTCLRNLLHKVEPPLQYFRSPYWFPLSVPAHLFTALSSHLVQFQTSHNLGLILKVFLKICRSAPEQGS